MMHLFRRSGCILLDLCIRLRIYLAYTASNEIPNHPLFSHRLIKALCSLFSNQLPPADHSSVCNTKSCCSSSSSHNISFKHMLLLLPAGFYRQVHKSVKVLIPSDQAWAKCINYSTARRSTYHKYTDMQSQKSSPAYIFKCTWTICHLLGKKKHSNAKSLCTRKWGIS
jgi:hypothetical protein